MSGPPIGLAVFAASWRAPGAGRYARNVEASYEPEASAPNWEIDPATLEIGPKVGQGEFGSVHKVPPST